MLWVSDRGLNDMLDNDSSAMVEAMEERHHLAGVEEDETAEFNDLIVILLLQKGGATGPVLKLPGACTNCW